MFDEDLNEEELEELAKIICRAGTESIATLVAVVHIGFGGSEKKISHDLQAAVKSENGSHRSEKPLSESEKQFSRSGRGPRPERRCEFNSVSNFGWSAGSLGKLLDKRVVRTQETILKVIHLASSPERKDEQGGCALLLPLFLLE